MAAWLTLIELDDDVRNLVDAWKEDGFFDENYGTESNEELLNEVGYDEEQVGDDSYSMYYVGPDYKDDPDLNWSLDCEGKEEFGKELESQCEEVVDVDLSRFVKSKNIYYDLERSKLRLHRIFKDPTQFKQAIVEDLTENCHQFQYKKKTNTLDQTSLSF
ncbi:hypothetical protein ACFE04_021270 [Oxalis oulophora]